MAKKDKVEKAVEAINAESWLTSTLGLMQEEIKALAEAEPRTKNFIKGVGPIIQKYAFMSQAFDGKPAVVGYKRAAKVAFGIMTAEQAAKGRA